VLLGPPQNISFQKKLDTLVKELEIGHVFLHTFWGQFMGKNEFQMNPVLAASMTDTM